MSRFSSDPVPPVRRPSQKGPAGSVMGVVLTVVWYSAALLLSAWLAGRRGEPVVAWSAVLLALFTGPIAMILLIASSGASSLEHKVEELVRAVRGIQDQSALSDDARRVLNRRQEREVLCQAIEEDIAAGSYDAALTLIRELADRCGYRADAETFRRAIDHARAATVEQELTDAIGSIDGLIMQRRFDQAYADAGRVMRLYPDSPRSRGLRDRVEHAREAFKADLERRFLVAAHEGRADDAMAFLKDLDAYLSPVEAEPLRELARGVIGRARDNLGARFKLAVQDRDWKEAAVVGERIIAEFPNSRMAGEVRDVIDGIRSRLQRPA